MTEAETPNASTSDPASSAPPPAASAPEASQPLPAGSSPAGSSPEGAEPSGPGQADGGGDGPRRRRRRRRGRRGGGMGEGEAAADGRLPQPPAGADPGPARLGAPRPPRPQHPHAQHQHPQHPGGGPGRGPRPQRSFGRGREHGQHGSQHHAMVAIQALSAMAEGLLEVEGIDFLSRPRWMDIQMRVPLDARQDGHRAASMIVEQILKRVQDVRAHDRALVPGAVYCFFTESAEVEHARPKEPREVFDGYTSTGRPKFTDFVTMAIERKDQNIDALLAGEDMVLTHVTMGRVLRTAQLAEFGKGSPVYRILGQVDAGLFAAIGSDRRCAYSFQLLRGTTLEGKPRLRLHWVGAVDPMDLADPSVALLLTRFQRELDAESLRLAGAEATGQTVEDDEKFALPILQDLARQLSGMARRKSRRTQHAVQRTEEGRRPTTKAYADAQQARDEDLLWDEVEGTVVVLGSQGRVHVFTAQGKHVTSFVMNGGDVSRRRQQGRWRGAEPSERGEFRIQLKRRVDTEPPPAEPQVAEPVAGASAPAPAGSSGGMADEPVAEPERGDEPGADRQEAEQGS